MILQNSDGFQAWLRTKQLPNLLSMERKQVELLDQKTTAAAARAGTSFGVDMIAHELPSKLLGKDLKPIRKVSHSAEATRAPLELDASAPETFDKVARFCLAANPPFHVGRRKQYGTGPRTSESEQGCHYWKCESCTEGECSARCVYDPTKKLIWLAGAHGSRMDYKNVDFFHIVKNVLEQVPRQLILYKKATRGGLGEAQKKGAALASRVRAWMWAVRLLFNPAAAKAFLQWKYGILEKEGQFPLICGSSSVETLQRKFLHSFRANAQTQTTRATGILRFLTTSVRPVVLELLPPRKKFTGFASLLQLPLLGTCPTDGGAIEVTISKKHRTKIVVNGTAVTPPASCFLMLKNEDDADRDTEAEQGAGDGFFDDVADGEADGLAGGSKLELQEGNGPAGLGLDEEDEDDDEATKIPGVVDLEAWWPTISALLFGSYSEAQKHIKSYKVLKLVSVVIFWPELYSAWGLGADEVGNGCPVCISHCRDFALHTACRCMYRALHKLDPAKYGPLFSHKKKGRPSKKTLAARARQLQAEAEGPAAKKLKRD
eukprot:g14042.t1